MLATAGLVLCLPECPTVAPPPANATPFAWNQDDVWDGLERSFVAARRRCDEPLELASLRALLANLRGAPPEDLRWAQWEARFYQASARAAACPEESAKLLVKLHEDARVVIRATATRWDLHEGPARQRLYRLLQGGRMAVEEVLLQMPHPLMPALVRGESVLSTGPCTELHATRVCSGDLLLSRGGAPTSALIARGSDFPGSFSHVALAHVAPTGELRTIEAHIERGVVVEGVARYEADPKLRVMLLRLRPGIAAAPGAPHRAAEHAMAEAARGHIPYDFAMDTADSGAQFCSEVASSAYAAQGVRLWRGLTQMSAPGTARWLTRFGVTHFETHGPSDLEHDPQLAVVAEWRDPEGLFGAHVDDAVVDAMLEGAEEGDDIGYDRSRLPLARLARAWSWLQRRLGRGDGVIPEGMSATVALRVQWLRQRHRVLRDDVLAQVTVFERNRGYRPPYWQLVTMARRARGRARAKEHR